MLSLFLSLHHVIFLKTSPPIFPVQIIYYVACERWRFFRHKGKEVAADDPFAKTVGEETPLFESDRFEKGERGWTQIVTAIPSSIHGTMLTFTSPWCLVTIHLCRRAMCGFLFVAMIRRFLGPFWLPPFPILIYAKGYRSSCPSSLNLVRVLPWVGRSGWTRSCLTWVSWWCYSRPVCWKPPFHLGACLTIATCSIFVIWFSDGVAPVGKT